jgi:hypothetical protein
MMRGMPILVPTADEKTIVLKAFREGFGKAYDRTKDARVSDREGQDAGLSAYLEMHPDLDVTLARSHVILIVTKELLENPTRFWAAAFPQSG